MHQVLVVKEKSDRLKNASVVAGRSVRITWSDEVCETKDLTPLLLNHRMFFRLRFDDRLFATLHVSADGQRLEWEDGSSIIARAIGRLPKASMDASELKGIMADLHLTSEGLGSLIGVSRRAITDYRAGAPIPKSVALAMRYLHERSET